MLEQIHWATNRRNKWKNLAVFAFDHREPFSALAAETGVKAVLEIHMDTLISSPSAAYRALEASTPPTSA